MNIQYLLAVIIIIGFFVRVNIAKGKGWKLENFAIKTNTKTREKSDQSL